MGVGPGTLRSDCQCQLFQDVSVQGGPATRSSKGTAPTILMPAAPLKLAFFPDGDDTKDLISTRNTLYLSAFHVRTYVV